MVVFSRKKLQIIEKVMSKLYERREMQSVEMKSIYLKVGDYEDNYMLLYDQLKIVEKIV